MKKHKPYYDVIVGSVHHEISDEELSELVSATEQQDNESAFSPVFTAVYEEYTVVSFFIVYDQETLKKAIQRKAKAIILDFDHSEDEKIYFNGTEYWCKVKPMVDKDYNIIMLSFEFIDTAEEECEEMMLEPPTTKKVNLTMTAERMRITMDWYNKMNKIIHQFKKEHEKLISVGNEILKDSVS